MRKCCGKWKVHCACKMTAAVSCSLLPRDCICVPPHHCGCGTVLVYVVLSGWMDWRLRLKYILTTAFTAYERQGSPMRSCPLLLCVLVAGRVCSGGGWLLYVHFARVHVTRWTWVGDMSFEAQRLYPKPISPLSTGKLWLRFLFVSFPNLPVLHSTQPLSWQSTSPKCFPIPGQG